MKRCLSLDIGRKHTGAAFFDERTKVPLPLETLHHASDEELLEKAVILASERAIDAFIIGLPYLPGGKEGEQAGFVREIAKKLCEACPWAELHFIDERFTNAVTHEDKAGDEHGQAALGILRVFLERHGTSC